MVRKRCGERYTICILTYKDDVEKLRKIENKGYLEYEENYFEYIPMLPEDETFYLNVERNGYWGYIDNSGKTLIDFEYDFGIYFQDYSRIAVYYTSLSRDLSVVAANFAPGQPVDDVEIAGQIYKHVTLDVPYPYGIEIYNYYFRVFVYCYVRIV